MKTSRTLTIVGGATIFAAVAWAQQPMSLLFKVEDGGSLSWLNGNNQTRGMTYNPFTGHLLVADNDSVAGNKIHVLDASSGAEIGTGMNNTGVGGGSVNVAKVGVAGDGRIYLSNIATAGANFRLYAYADETAAPTVAYAETPAAKRWGDSIAVIGSGNNTKILMTGWQNPTIALLTTTDGGQTFTKIEITPDVAMPNALNFVSWDPSGTAFWTRAAAASSADQTTSVLYALSGANATAAGQKAVAAGLGAMTVVTKDATKLMGLAPANVNAGSTDVKGVVWNVDTDTAFATTGLGLEKTGGAVANGNGTGDVAIDTANGRVWFLYTNNSISGWFLPSGTTAAEDWNLFL
ncbi:MAG: hypothetical protein N2Z21_07225 [Candidatus Sumerlaeaceae bacterium]|nr:hypothetical protein [Candidatus Sumerlaeaceae bacterium]